MNFKFISVLSLSVFSLNVACIAMESKSNNNYKVYDILLNKSAGGWNFSIIPIENNSDISTQKQVNITVIPDEPMNLNFSREITISLRKSQDKFGRILEKLFDIFGDERLSEDRKTWNQGFINTLRYCASNEYLWTLELCNMRSRGVTSSQIFSTIGKYQHLKPAELQHKFFKFLPENYVNYLISAENKIPFKK